MLADLAEWPQDMDFLQDLMEHVGVFIMTSCVGFGGGEVRIERKTNKASRFRSGTERRCGVEHSTPDYVPSTLFNGCSLMLLLKLTSVSPLCSTVPS